MTHRDPPAPAGSREPLTAVFDAALCDLDGTVFNGSIPIDNAGESIARARRAGMSFAFLTNNASRTPGEVAGHLATMGIEAEAREICTASQAGAQMVADEVPPGSKVLAVGGPGVSTALAEAGLVPVYSALKDPVAVLQGWGANVDWPLLAEATYAIKAGASYFATNLDATLPTERGFAPGNGSLVAAVVNATGVRPTSAGKPEPGILLAAARRIKARVGIVVGDRLETDIAGARKARMASMVVMTGVTGVRALLAAPVEHRPDFIGRDLLALCEPHPSPRLEADATGGVWHVVGEARARRGPDGPLLAAGGSGIDRLRAAACLAWGSDLAPKEIDQLAESVGPL